MNITCQQCKKEFKSNANGTRKFCVNACRTAFNRNKRNSSTVTPTVTTVTDEPTVTTDTPNNTLNEITVTLNDVCTPEELKDWPNMCETKRVQKEAIFRLENNELEDLKAAKIFIPAWRHHGKKYGV